MDVPLTVRTDAVLACSRAILDSSGPVPISCDGFHKHDLL